MSAAEIGGAALTGGSSIIATGMSNHANKNIAQMNNAFNERMLQKQMDYNTDMYNKQLGDQWAFYKDAKQNQWDMFNATNRYNSASAQRQRLESAGLNPYLMMSGSSAGTASSTAGSSADSPGAQGVNPPSASPYTANFDGYADAIGRVIDAGTKMANQRKIRAEAEQVQIENKYIAQKMMADINNTISTTRNNKEKVQLQKFLAQTQKDLATAQISNYEQNMAESRQRMTMQAVDTMIKEKNLAFLPTLQKLQVSSQLADIALKQKQGNLTDKQAKKEVSSRISS